MGKWQLFLLRFHIEKDRKRKSVRLLRFHLSSVSIHFLYEHLVALIFVLIKYNGCPCRMPNMEQRIIPHYNMVQTSLTIYRMGSEVPTSSLG